MHVDKWRYIARNVSCTKYTVSHEHRVQSSASAYSSKQVLTNIGVISSPVIYSLPMSWLNVPSTLSCDCSQIRKPGKKLVCLVLLFQQEQELLHSSY
uniref:Uncharacterized protein n=1 Tax=Rhipicephalus appendiculatus TaxID=34631 RepID=A0A131YAH4_RHIAP